MKNKLKLASLILIYAAPAWANPSSGRPYDSGAPIIEICYAAQPAPAWPHSRFPGLPCWAEYWR